jgi:integrase
MKLREPDPFGNAMPPGMFFRDGIYYVKRQIGGVLQKQSTRKRDFKSALRRYHEIMKAWNDGESGWSKPGEAPSFEEYWRDNYRPAYTVRKTPLKSSDPKDLKFRDDQLVVGFLSTADARRPLTHITKTMCQKWANARRRETYTRKEGGELHTIAEGTVTREISFLQAVFQQAVEDGILEKNPWKSIEREDYATKERVLTTLEQEKLLRVLTPRYQRWMLFLLGTGLRLEEARGIMEATDLDFAKRTVRVTRKTRGRKKKVQDVPIIEASTLDILQEQLTEDGQLWHQNQQRFREVLSEAAERAGIAHLSPHTLRHTFATRYLQGGGDIYVLSKILGHSSVAVTEKVYAHLLGEDLLARSRHIKLGLEAQEPARVIPFERGKG